MLKMYKKLNLFYSFICFCCMLCFILLFLHQHLELSHLKRVVLKLGQVKLMLKRIIIKKDKCSTQQELLSFCITNLYFGIFILLRLNLKFNLIFTHQQESFVGVNNSNKNSHFITFAIFIARNHYKL